MSEKADLHIHTTASDGSMSPKKIIDVATELRLQAIALTDHDTVRGIKPAHHAAKDTELTVMNGVEVTTAFEGREIHLLAYAFNLNDNRLIELLKTHKKARVARAKEIIHLLQKEGLQLTIDEVLAEANSQTVCRPHIAAVLVSKGYVASQKEAFLRYLSDDALGDIKVVYQPLDEVIATVKEAGGVSIIAHPGRLYNKKQLNKMIDAGADGIETVHPSHSHDIQKRLEKLAQKYHLLTTGGSDFHGREKDYYKHLGTLGIRMRQLEKINQIANHRKKITT